MELAICIEMKRFQTCVSEEVAAKFLQFCVDRQQTPYDVLSSFVHKVTGIERPKHEPSPYQQALLDRQPVDPQTAIIRSGKAKPKCCRLDCFGEDRLKCRTTDKENPRHADE
jgi:hypothetical protein